MTNRLTDEEVWLQIYCSAITSTVDDRPSDVAESGLEEFRKRFPASEPAKTEIGVTWSKGNNTESWYGAYGDYQLSVYHSIADLWCFNVRRGISELGGGIGRKTDEESKSAAEDTLQEVLQNV